MQLVALDFETHYSNEFTLSKLTTEAYIRDPRFEALLVGYALPDGRTGYIEQGNLKSFFAGIDWANTGVVAHHAHFDGLILSHHFGCKPAMWFDTLSMGRQLFGNSLGLSLASLARHYGLQGKTVPYDLFIGRRWGELDAMTRKMLGDGAAHDCELTMRIFGEMLKTFPREELEIVDTTVRMFTEPCLLGDADKFAELRDTEFLRKNERLYELDVGESDLQSAAKFVAILEREGVEVEYKEGKNGPIPAIAATDQFMRGLVDGNEGPVVAEIAQARLDVKSTISETRCGRLHDMARRGPVPVYLNYCGAHTTRWSGGDKSNMQNMPRGSAMRHALHAPEGHLLAMVDQEQGECRVVNWLAGQWDVLEKFKNGVDLYSELATTFYGFPVSKKTPKERGTGKQLVLSCGFGAGAETIRLTAKRGTYGPPVELTPDQALQARDLYRATHPEVCKLWKTASAMLHTLANKEEGVWGPMKLRDGKIILPNGGWIDYSTLEWWADPETGKRGWRTHSRRGWAWTHGAKLVENVVQALSRVITSQAMLRVKAAGYHIVMSSHDDFVPLVKKDGREQEALRFLEQCMAVTPDWAPGIPLAASGKLSPYYD